MHRNTVIDMVLVLVKEVEYRNENELKLLAKVETLLYSMKDREMEGDM